MIQAKLVHKPYIECPDCGDTNSFSIGHLINTDQSFGRWYCDNCGCAIMGETKKNGNIYFSKCKEKRTEQASLLRLNNILVLVKHHDYGFDKLPDSDRFFFEDHQCPENIMNMVQMVINLENGEADQHGLFEYLATIDWADNMDEYTVNEIKELFKEKKLIES